jgi:hypothetical protein
MGCPSEHRSEMTIPLTASQRDVRTPHCARMEWDAPHRIGRDSHNSLPSPDERRCASRRRNGASEPLTPSQGDVATRHCARMEWDAPHRIGGKCHNLSPRRGKGDSPQSIRMKCLKPSLRPNEISGVSTAREWNGMLLIASEGNATTPHRPGRKWDSLRASE